jgi:hypothetical protein
VALPITSSTLTPPAQTQPTATPPAGNSLAALTDAHTPSTAAAAVIPQSSLDALAKTMAPLPTYSPTSPSAFLTVANQEFAYRCSFGFNPTKTTDPEGQINKILGCATQKDAHVRQDRSLASLLDPIQYYADPSMVVPTSSAATMGALTTVVPRFSAPSADKYYPIYAAAGFCQNLSQHAFVYLSTPTTSSSPSVAQVAFLPLQEAAESRILANCWAFFEERVAYPSSSAGSPLGSSLYLTQKARCAVDYANHIIDDAAYGDCVQNGRSELKARADMAYRYNSAAYVSYLQSLGAAPAATIFAMSLGDPEKFEQSLLIERQIMTEAMSSIHGPLGGANTNSILSLPTSGGPVSGSGGGNSTNNSTPGG